MVLQQQSKVSRTPIRNQHLKDLTVGYYVCTVIALGFLLASNRFFHWFIIPVILCGIVVTLDALAWLREELDLFDPVGLIGIFGFFFFFLNPLLVVLWDFKMLYIVSLGDWRPWIGFMALLNLFGLLAYRMARAVVGQAKSDATRITKKVSEGIKIWRIDHERFRVVFAALILITGLLQIWVYRQYGGVQGYISHFEARDDSFANMGWIFTISESLPILAFIGFAVYADNKKSRQSWIVLAIVLIGFFVLKIVFGGLRGSRSNTIWGMLWAAGIIHFWLRPIKKIAVYLGLIILIFFSYLYGFYKFAGLDALDLVQKPATRLELEERSHRTLNTIIISDFGRSDIQAFLLYRMMDPESHYEYAWGRTYVGAAALFIPRQVWPDRPPTKVMEGTEALYGLGSFIPNVYQSSRVYGLAGEGMLNFGPLLIPGIFALFGLVVAKTQDAISEWRLAKDFRLLIAPLFVLLCILILTGDSDNNVFFLVKNGAVPLFAILMSSRIERTTGLRDS